jgi:predicted nucleotidyltransferase
MKDVLFQVTYGSRLYGTNTPTSDTDLKSVFLPAIDDLLLGRKLGTSKTRVHSDGSPVPDKSSMPDNGVEHEYFPLQTFVRDFVQGQTYALEMAWAVLANGPDGHTLQAAREHELMVELVEKFGNCSVYSMVSFAMKQTFDYVKRGERLEQARELLDVLNVCMEMFDCLDAMDPGSYLNPRLDTVLPDGEKLLHKLSRETNLELGTSVNNNRAFETLKLNGREYLETTAVSHLVLAVQKLVSEYGERTNRAAKEVVDYKSLSHAVRVYEQALELLDTGRLTFPRPNADYLRSVKQGLVPLEEVKARLLELDEEVLAKQESSTQRRKTPELVEASEEWLLTKLRQLYLLD